MSVRLKLVVIVLFVALVPLAVSAFTALGVHRRAYDAKVAELQRTAANAGARQVTGWITEAGRNLASVTNQIPWRQLTEAERSGALSLVYGQVEQVAVVQLLDDDGQGVGAAIYLTPEDDTTAGHPRVTSATLDVMARNLPAPGEPRGAAFSAAGETTPMLTMSIPLPGQGETWRLVVALSLAPLCDELTDAIGSQLVTVLLDEQGRRLCPVGPSLLAASPAVDKLRTDQLFHYTDDDDGHLSTMVAAATRTDLGWTVLAAQPAARATAPGRRMRTQTLFWISISVLVALGAGLYLARSITAPIHQLATGANALAAGELGHRIQVSGRDELAELATTFNHMSSEIQQRDEEIRKWNAELKQRVEDRTRELKEAQEQLLQSQKIAAVSSLAAGVAHEINNPLTGVLGMAQLLRMKANEGQQTALDSIEREAKRIRDIVKTLQSLSELSDKGGFCRIDVNDIAETTVELIRGRATEAAIELTLETSPTPVSAWVNALQLRDVLLHLLENSLTATSANGTIRLRTESIEGKLAKVTVSDTGRGISAENLARIYEPFFTTKDNWEGRGLGLTVAYRIIQAHNGTIKVESKPGEGTRVTVTLPSEGGGAHLV